MKHCAAILKATGAADFNSTHQIGSAPQEMLLGLKFVRAKVAMADNRLLGSTEEPLMSLPFNFIFSIVTDFPRDRTSNRYEETGMLKTANLLDISLIAAKQDSQVVSPEGAPLRRLTHGVTIRDLPTHVDERGSLMELFDPRWNWHPEALVFAYCFTLRPGCVKGWGLHKEHEDRYVLIQGEMELVLYDPRPESPTVGEVCRIQLTPYRRCIINIPRNVWHADHNIGATDVLTVNFPTMAYDHTKPDKYRLPIDTDIIPYRFPEGVRGG